MRGGGNGSTWGRQGGGKGGAYLGGATGGLAGLQWGDRVGEGQSYDGTL
jgi:hypothetical protein